MKADPCALTPMMAEGLTIFTASSSLWASPTGPSGYEAGAVPEGAGAVWAKGSLWWASLSPGRMEGGSGGKGEERAEIMDEKV